MAIAAFTGNILVLTVNHCSKDQNMTKTTRLIFSNLAASDFLMSIYLFIIAIGDVFYRNRYAQHAEEWLRSPACAMASFLICTSSLMSVIMMLLISIDRYIVTSNPFSSSDVRYKTIKIVLASGWLLTCTFVGTPIIMSIINKTGDLRLYQFSSICSPSNINNDFFASWMFLFVSVQLLFWILTAVFYLLLLKEVDKSRRSIRSSAQSRNFAIAIRLSLILITDLITWLPVYVLLAMTLINGKLDIFTLQFAIILAMPLNAAINPYIYTTTGTVGFNRLLTFISTRTSSSQIKTKTNSGAIQQNDVAKVPVPSNKIAKLPVDRNKVNEQNNQMMLVTVWNVHSEDINDQLPITVDHDEISSLNNEVESDNVLVGHPLLLNVTSKDNNIISNLSADNSIGNLTANDSEDRNIKKGLIDNNNDRIEAGINNPIFNEYDCQTIS